MEINHTKLNKELNQIIEVCMEQTRYEEMTPAEIRKETTQEIKKLFKPFITATELYHETKK